MIEAAIAYAFRLKWPVFPVTPGGKLPLIAKDNGGNGCLDATLDRALITRWWIEAPRANIGVACGPASGFFVVDVDPRHGGDVSLRELEQQHGELPRTVRARTGGGGQHILFKHVDGIRNSANRIAPGIDTRGDGGYILVAPSVHDSGRKYEWLPDCGPRLIEIAEAPAWLLDLVIKKPPPPPPANVTYERPSERYVAAAFDAELAELANSREGGRNATLNEAAFSLGQFVGAGVMSRGQVEAALTAKALSIGLNPIETAKTIKSGIDSGMKEPRKVPQNSERRPRRAAPAAAPPETITEDGEVVMAKPAAAVASIAEARELRQAKAAVGGAAPASTPAPAPSSGSVEELWRQRLIQGDRGPRALVANAITALRGAPEWQGVIAYDEFTMRTVRRGKAPWEAAARPGEHWTDTDDVLTANWLQHKGIHVRPDVAGQAVETVARDAMFHPVREFFLPLMWDGVHRLDAWAVDYCGVEDTEYARAISSKWMISAVARVMQPGCKADCVLIMQGPQGLKKSTALSILGGAFFTDELADIGSKDAAMQLSGAWIVEMSELESAQRSEAAKIKAFLSRKIDRYRPSYGRRVNAYPRQCVFSGTTNLSEFLKDESGGRRFWPLVCTKIDIGGLEAVRDQLWAEARDRFLSGESWWIESADLEKAAREVQTAAYQSDPWEEPIWTHIKFISSVSVGELLRDALKRPVEQWTQTDQNRVARCLRALGWDRYKEGKGPQRGDWRYRPGPTIEAAAEPTSAAL